MDSAHHQMATEGVKEGLPIGGTREAPIYTKARHSRSVNTFYIICDEGWRTSIVAERMYEWAADWLLTILGRQPFAPEHRPGDRGR